MLQLRSLVDDAKCFETVRHLRWPQGVRCPHCDSSQVVRKGTDDAQPARQRYACRHCDRRFDDLPGTVLAGHHQPLAVWILCLYLMGLKLSNEQIAKELGINDSDVHVMIAQLRRGIVQSKPDVSLSGEVECDEVYITAGHKGHPEAVKKGGASPADVD